MAREKSNYFTNLILELSSNKNEEDREKSRESLQQQSEARNSRLRELVKENRENISSSVKLCSSIIHSVSESQTRCRALKDRISRCMDMLQCNRDNIRRMWLESLEHQYAHKILSEIEDLRAAPNKVKESLVNKKLEHATEVIVASVKLLDGNLCNAEALKDLKLELHNLQEKLYSMILEDLRKNLHLTDFLADHYGEALSEATYEDIFSVKISKSDFCFKELANQVCLDQDYINVLLNSVKTMKRLPETLEFLKENCQAEFTTMFHEVSKLMKDVIERSADVSPLDLSIEKQHIFLIDLVENLICIFQKIVSNYKSFFTILENIVQSLDMTDIDFKIEDVYSKLQVAIETCLAIYFESNTLSSPSDSVVFENSQAIGGINVFFSSQELSDDKSLPLFKFSNSFHGINMKKFSAETKILETELDFVERIKQAAKPVLICRPALKNIIVVYNLLKTFVSEIEQSLNLIGDEHCPLYAFLNDVANLFLDHINSDINRTLKSAYANLDAWNTIPIGDCTGSKSGFEKEVLSCSLILENILKELKNLMCSIPDYSTHFLRLLYFVILDYKDMYHKTFKQMFEEEQNILSVSWARDRDIRRLMKSFLNWRHLEDDAVVDVIESPEEIRLRNKEESELLIRNLRSEDENWEIIADKNKLSHLALLQENLIWFSIELLKFIKNFNQSQTSRPDAQPTASSDSVSSAVSGLRKVIKEYEDFADMCLLALHLEVRARCFHYLLEFSAGREACDNFTRELDEAVKRLTSDLLQIDEALLPILTPKEFKYVFEGLGELVASLMILVVSNLGKISEAVVGRIDRSILVIQCCLANITMSREVSLERARQFIDLLKSTREEILDQIVEGGPRFEEEEYAAVFRLISSAGTTGPSRQPEYYTEKLKLIFERLAAGSAREATKDL